MVFSIRVYLRHPVMVWIPVQMLHIITPECSSAVMVVPAAVVEVPTLVIQIPKCASELKDCQWVSHRIAQKLKVLVSFVFRTYDLLLFLLMVTFIWPSAIWGMGLATATIASGCAEVKCSATLQREFPSTRILLSCDFVKAFCILCNAWIRLRQRKKVLKRVLLNFVKSVAEHKHVDVNNFLWFVSQNNLFQLTSGSVLQWTKDIFWKTKKFVLIKQVLNILFNEVPPHSAISLWERLTRVLLSLL